MNEQDKRILDRGTPCFLEVFYQTVSFQHAKKDPRQFKPEFGGVLAQTQMFVSTAFFQAIKSTSDLPSLCKTFLDLAAGCPALFNGSLTLVLYSEANQTQVDRNGVVFQVRLFDDVRIRLEHQPLTREELSRSTPKPPSIKFIDQL